MIQIPPPILQGTVAQNQGLENERVEDVLQTSNQVRHDPWREVGKLVGRGKPSFLPPEESLSGLLAPQPSDITQRLLELEASVSQQEQQLEGLLNIAASLRQSTTPEEAMQAIVVQISQLLGADRTTIYEVSEDRTMLNGLAVQGDASIKVMIQSGRGIAGMVAKERRVINLRDAYEHPNFDIRVDRPYWVSNEVCPLRSHVWLTG